MWGSKRLSVSPAIAEHNRVSGASRSELHLVWHANAEVVQCRIRRCLRKASDTNHPSARKGTTCSLSTRKSTSATRCRAAAAASLSEHGGLVTTGDSRVLRLGPAAPLPRCPGAPPMLNLAGTGCTTGTSVAGSCASALTPCTSAKNPTRTCTWLPCPRSTSAAGWPVALYSATRSDSLVPTFLPVESTSSLGVGTGSTGVDGWSRLWLQTTLRRQGPVQHRWLFAGLHPHGRLPVDAKSVRRARPDRHGGAHAQHCSRAQVKSRVPQQSRAEISPVSNICLEMVRNRDLACPEGIEPPTTRLEGRCSIQLSYGQGRTKGPGRAFIDLVGAKGFEPSTLWSQTRCATRLRYAPKPPF